MPPDWKKMQVVLDKDGNVSPEGTSAVAAGCGIKQPCTAGVTSFELQDSYDRVVVNAAGEVDVMESKDETEFLAEGEQEEGSNEARKLHAMGLAKANWAALYSRVFGPQTSQAAAATGRAFESGQRRAATAAATAATATAEIAVEARKSGAGAGEVDSSSNLGVTADVWWERPLGADGSVPEPRDTAGTSDGAIGRPAPPGGSRAASGGGTAHRYERWRSEWAALRGRQLDLQNKPHLNTADRLGEGGAESVEALSGALSEQINYLVRIGWEEEKARAYTLLTCCCALSMAEVAKAQAEAAEAAAEAAAAGAAGAEPAQPAKPALVAQAQANVEVEANGQVKASDILETAATKAEVNGVDVEMTAASKAEGDRVAAMEVDSRVEPETTQTASNATRKRARASQAVGDGSGKKTRKGGKRQGTVTEKVGEGPENGEQLRERADVREDQAALAPLGIAATASLQLLDQVMSELVQKQGDRVAPEVYAALEGDFGLATMDATWIKLKEAWLKKKEMGRRCDAATPRSGASAAGSGSSNGEGSEDGSPAASVKGAHTFDGVEIRTRTLVTALADKEAFVDGCGLHARVCSNGFPEWVPCYSDVVRFLSRSPCGRRRRSLVHAGAMGYQLPRNSTVTLVSVSERFQAYNTTLRQHLYTVHVDFEADDDAAAASLGSAPAGAGNGCDVIGSGVTNGAVSAVEDASSVAASTRSGSRVVSDELSQRVTPWASAGPGQAFESVSDRVGCSCDSGASGDSVTMADFLGERCARVGKGAGASQRGSSCDDVIRLRQRAPPAAANGRQQSHVTFARAGEGGRASEPTTGACCDGGQDGRGEGEGGIEIGTFAEATATVHGTADAGAVTARARRSHQQTAKR